MNSYPDYELQVAHHMQQSIQSEIQRFRLAAALPEAPATRVRTRIDRALVRLAEGASERLRLAEHNQ